MYAAVRRGTAQVAARRATSSTSATAMRCTPSSSSTSVAAFHTSRVARADAHADADHGPYTSADFTSPIWIRSLVVLVAGVGLYKLNATVGIDDDSDDKRPWLTRYLAYNKPDPKIWEKNEEKHMTMARERAATKLFLQDAEHPPIIRMRGGAANLHDGPMARQQVGV